MVRGLRLVLFGPPGAGKGTQAELLKERLKVAHISSGDLFRSSLQEGSPLGLKVGQYMEKGLLVPDAVTIDLILDKVLSINAEDGFILDGFPRSPNQAKALTEALERRSRGLDKVVHIDVPEQELIRRLGGRYCCKDCQAPHTIELTGSDNGSEAAPEQVDARCSKCGGELYQRTDDRPEAVRQRIEVYRSETMPLLDFYRSQGILIEVPGSGNVEFVNLKMMAALESE